MAKWTPNYDVYEVFGSRNESWSLGNSTVTVSLQCDMAERHYALADIVGEHRAYPFDTPSVLYALDGRIRLDRARKDSTPGTVQDPEGRQRYVSGYESFLDITYGDWQNLWWINSGNIEPFPDQLEHGEEFEPSMEFATDDYHKFGWSETESTGPMDQTNPRKFDGDSILKQGEEIGIPFYKITLSRTVMGYFGLPVGYSDFGQTQGNYITPVPFEEWPGYVHAKDFKSDFTGITYPAGTLLFTQPQVDHGIYRIAYDTSGAFPIGIGKTYKISANLIYQPQGWNAFYRSVCENDQDKKGWYNMVYLRCDPQQGFRTGYNPYKFLDMSQFIFSSLNQPKVI